MSPLEGRPRELRRAFQQKVAQALARRKSQVPISRSVAEEYREIPQPFLLVAPTRSGPGVRLTVQCEAVDTLIAAQHPIQCQHSTLREAAYYCRWAAGRSAGRGGRLYLCCHRREELPKLLACGCKTVGVVVRQIPGSDGEGGFPSLHVHLPPGMSAVGTGDRSLREKKVSRYTYGVSERREVRGAHVVPVK